MKIPELLAPVGNMNHLKLAVYNGASSIYLSGKEFGARKYAENFSLGEIEEASKFAHLYNVKVYVTVNILIKEKEIPEVIDYIIRLYEIGIDGLLIQDVGLIRIVHEIIPNLPIHASTQLNIHNLEDVDWAKEMGIKRIVLPRELKLKEAKEITKYAHQNGIEVEMFLHGALCYSYSGHCLLSSYIGGRSGNRGRCAQPCRLKYSLCCENGNSLDENFLIESKRKYYLSPKDLSLYDDLERILFVDSLKIEGRMRNEEYVSVVVNTYRQALNKLRHNKHLPHNEELSLVFNRKFTRGHLLDNPNRIMNYKKPSNNGLFIGNVVDFNGKNTIKVELSGKTIPEKGDGILIEGKPLENSQRDTYGFELSIDPKFEDDFLVLKTIRENKNINIKIDNNSKVYISKRKAIKDETKQGLNGENHSYKKSVLDIDFKVNKNRYPIIKGHLKLGNGKTVELKYKGKNQWEEAINKPVDSKKIRENFNKTDNLPFYIKHVNVNYTDNLFTPMSNLNKLRRDFYQKLTEEIEESYIPKDLDKVKSNYKEYKNNYFKNKYSKTEKNCENKNLSIYINSLEALKEINKNPIFKRVYLEIPPNEMNILSENYKERFNINYCVNFIKKAYELSLDKDYNLVWMWPKVCCRDTINGLFKTLGILHKLDIYTDIMASNYRLAEILKNYNINVYGSQGLNLYNHETANSLNSFDILTISTELSKEDIKDLRSNSDTDKLEIIIGGILEAMITRKPIMSKKDIKNIRKELNIKISKDTDLNISIKDKNNHYYPVKGTITEDLYILYYERLSLIKELDYLNNIGMSNYAIDLRWESAENVNKISEIFRNALESLKNLDDLNQDLINNFWYNATQLNFNRQLQ